MHCYYSSHSRIKEPYIVNYKLIQHQLLYVPDENYNTCKRSAGTTKGRGSCKKQDNKTYITPLANYSHPHGGYVN